MKRNKLHRIMLFMVALGLSAFSASAQTIFEKGLHAEVQAGTLIQKYPYGALSGVVGHTNDNGFFWGFGAKAELPLATDPALKVFPHEYPGPYSGERMVGAFFEMRKSLTDSGLPLFADLKIGPAYNLTGKEGAAFVIPAIGLSSGKISAMLGCEIGAGLYDEGINYGPDVYGVCGTITRRWSFLPSISITIAF